MVISFGPLSMCCSIESLGNECFKAMSCSLSFCALDNVLQSRSFNIQLFFMVNFKSFYPATFFDVRLWRPLKKYKYIQKLVNAKTFTKSKHSKLVNL